MTPDSGQRLRMAQQLLALLKRQPETEPATLAFWETAVADCEAQMAAEPNPQSFVGC